MGNTYIVQKGDTLSDIAQRYGTNVASLVALNKISDPNRIYAGQELKLKNNVANSYVNGTQVGGYKSTGSSDSKDTGFKYANYTPSGAVTNAGNALQNAANAVASYGKFTYGNEQAYNDVINKIMNREKFSYDLNGDALYQQYKDMYMKQGQLAMQDTMGQAAALTGGYGNSYAATAGNQAYQAHLDQLNNIIPELYQMAYDRYNQEGQDLYNQYGLLSSDRSQQYGEWEAGYNRALAERDYAQGLYDSERSYDYGLYSDKLNFDYGVHRDGVSDQQWEKAYDEGIRQFDEDLKERQRQFDETQKKNNSVVVYDDEDYYDDETTYDDDPPKVEEEDGGNFTPVNTKAVTDFKASVRTRNEFYGRSSPEKEKYKTYEAYLEGKIRAASDRLTDDEVATLIAYYGLENF